MLAFMNLMILLREPPGPDFLTHQGIPYLLQEAIYHHQLLLLFSLHSSQNLSCLLWLNAIKSLRQKNSESMWQIRSRFQGSPIVSSRERNMQSRQSSDCLASLWNSASWLRLQCDISVIWANVDEVSQTWEEAESTSCPFEISGPNNV